MEALIPGLLDDLAEECLLRVRYDNLFILDFVCRWWRDQVRSPYFHSRRRLAGITSPIFGVIQTVPKQYNNISTDECESSLTLFNPVSGIWHLLPPIPDLPNLNGEQVIIVGVGRLFVAIGRHHPSSVSIYDCLASAWREGASMPGEQGILFTCVSDGINRVYVAGGCEAQFKDRHRIRSVMCYDVEEDRWEILPDMVEGSLFYEGAFYSGKLYLMKQKYVGLASFKYFTYVYDVSSHEFHIVDTAEQMKLEYWDNTYEFAFGRIYCCGRDGKLKVREDKEWRELGDLPGGMEYHMSHFCCWDGGVFVLSVTDDNVLLPSGIPSGKQCYEVHNYTLQNQNSPCTRHQLPRGGEIEYAFLLEI